MTFSSASFAPRLFFLMFGLAATMGVVFGGAWASIGIAGALLLGGLTWFADKRFPRPAPFLAFLVFSLLALMWASSVYASHPAATYWGAFKMTTILVPLLWLSSPAVQKRVLVQPLSPLFLALLLGLGFVSFEAVAAYYTHFDPSHAIDRINKMNRGLSYGALLLWPILAGLMAKAETRKAGWLLLGVFAATFPMTDSQATQAGFLAAGLLFVLARISFPLALAGAGIGSVLSLLWPVAASASFVHCFDFVQKLPASWHMRVEIWDYVAQRIADKPFWGYGFSNAPFVDIASPNGIYYVFVKETVSHPHNAVLQIWVEIGLPGLFLIGLLCFGVLRQISRLSASLRPYALAAYAFAFSLSMTAYHFWTDSLWAAFTLTSLLFLCLVRAEIKASLSSNRQDERESS